MTRRGSDLTRITTLCGSMRFFDRMLEVAGELTLAGEIILAPFVYIPNEQQAASLDKKQLDQLHFEKIDMSESIFVVNVGGYIGESTAREIQYARSTGKLIRSVEPLPPPRGRCIRCGSNRSLNRDGTIPKHYPMDGGDNFEPGEPRCPQHGNECGHIVCPGSWKPPRKEL